MTEILPIRRTTHRTISQLIYQYKKATPFTGNTIVYHVLCVMRENLFVEILNLIRSNRKEENKM